MRGSGRPGWLVAVVFLGLLWGSAGAAGAAPAGSGAARSGTPHDNVAQPHSPRLLR
jgi:hypothetical protein